MINAKDRRGTQRFMVESVLARHRGEALSPEKIDEICKEMVTEMTKGPMAWAFESGHASKRREE